MNIQMKQFLAFVVLMVLVFGTIFVASKVARAHSDGHMQYDHFCCHDRDCGPATKITNADGGDTYTSKHGSVTVLPGDNVRRLPSKDDRFHICMRDATEYELNTPDHRLKRPICIYSPTLY